MTRDRKCCASHTRCFRDRLLVQEQPVSSAGALQIPRRDFRYDPPAETASLAPSPDHNSVTLQSGGACEVADCARMEHLWVSSVYGRRGGGRAGRSIVEKKAEK